MSEIKQAMFVLEQVRKEVQCSSGGYWVLVCEYLLGVIDSSPSDQGEAARLQLEIAEADAWCENWRREAFRKYPTPEAYESACKALEKHRGEAARLRNVESTLRILMERIRHDQSYTHTREYAEAHNALEALSSHTEDTGIQKVREPVRWFAERMEQTLRANDYKGGWKHCSFKYLLHRMREELKELRLAIEAYSDEEIIIREAADVANFAMMVADNMRRKAGIAIPGINTEVSHDPT
jgi:hypothetical protein